MRRLLIVTLIVVGFTACQTGNKKTTDEKTSSVPVELVQTKIEIGGMDCDMCVKSVEKGVGELAGITSVTVSLSDSSALVKYDAGKVQLAEIEKAIEKRGYSIKATL